MDATKKAMVSKQPLYKNSKDMEVQAEQDQSLGQDDILYFHSPKSFYVCNTKKKKKRRQGRIRLTFLFLTLCSSKLKHLWGVDKCSCSVPRGICHVKQTTHGYRDIPPKMWRHKKIQSAPAKVFSLIFSIEIYLWKQRDKETSWSKKQKTFFLLSINKIILQFYLFFTEKTG